ncbi:hypothetical protein BD311DRAFT_426714 [Dichomitus squalens]|uniref:Uncharacterized protein n=1 Tax=Dichomitus squalens TaxID=114155 RepID=A0A4Q9MGF4_9APHY|nr:hypothetical protein BD311DRAFT_426714 [Dichomitus squalens]
MHHTRLENANCSRFPKRPGAEAHLVEYALRWMLYAVDWAITSFSLPCSCDFFAIRLRKLNALVSHHWKSFLLYIAQFLWAISPFENVFGPLGHAAADQLNARKTARELSAGDRSLDVPIPTLQSRPPSQSPVHSLS